MRTLAFLLTGSLLIAACGSGNGNGTDAGTDTSGLVTCASDVSVGWSNYGLCAAGTGGNLGAMCPATNPPDTCNDTRPIAACCAWVANPGTTPLARAPSSLHYNGQPAGQPNVDLSCTTTPPMQGTPQMVTLTGYVKVFLGQDNDSAGVQLQIYQQGTDGALGPAVGTAVTTTPTSPSRTNTWLSGCPTNGCTERQFTYMNVPTETPLIIHTSDANMANTWADFYDYNVYFANSTVTGGMVSYDTTGVGTDDILTVTATVGYSVVSGKGLLAGEVHDCGDVRLQNAEVNTDYRPQGDVFYFGSDETDPLPDKTASSTSDLGLFGAVNYPVGVPIHISAVGYNNGATTLVGAYTVQVFSGAVTGLSLRGRRPFQQD